MSRLTDRVYVVTGSTQGLGRAVAERLVADGAAAIVVSGRNRERGAEVVRVLERAGAKAAFVAAELERETDCRAIIAEANSRFGRLDGLVNCAGLSDRGDLESTTVPLWDKLFAVNVRAPFILAQDAVKLMKRGGRGGVIVSVSSMSSYGGQSFLMAYSTSKGALGTLTKNLANALRRDRIRVNAVNLGWSSTPGEDAIQRRGGAPADWLARAETAQPFGRLLHPTDLAALIAHVVSDDGQMMTGALIDLDQNVMGTYD